MANASSTLDVGVQEQAPGGNSKTPDKTPRASSWGSEFWSYCPKLARVESRAEFVTPAWASPTGSVHAAPSRSLDNALGQSARQRAAAARAGDEIPNHCAAHARSERHVRGRRRPGQQEVSGPGVTTNRRGKPGPPSHPRPQPSWRGSRRGSQRAIDADPRSANGQHSLRPGTDDERAAHNARSSSPQQGPPARMLTPAACTRPAFPFLEGRVAWSALPDARCSRCYTASKCSFVCPTGLADRRDPGEAVRSRRRPTGASLATMAAGRDDVNREPRSFRSHMATMIPDAWTPNSLSRATASSTLKSGDS